MLHAELSPTHLKQRSSYNQTCTFTSGKIQRFHNADNPTAHIPAVAKGLEIPRHCSSHGRKPLYVVFCEA